MPKLITIGEMLIDFTASQKGLLKDCPFFIKNAGGAPANVAVCHARLGGEAMVISCLGQDAFGDFLADTLRGNRVQTTGIVRSKEHRTPLAFVSLDHHGERDFTFYRSDSSDLFLGPEDIRGEWFEKGDILHFGSVDLVDFPVRKAHEKAIALAHQHQCIVSFDPNLRFNLWPSSKTLKETVLRFLPLAHVVKLSKDELEFLTDQSEVAQAVGHLFQGRVMLICVTDGANGSTIYASKKRSLHVPAEKIEVIDATGAGDAFVGTFLHFLLEAERTSETLCEHFSDYTEILRKANHVAAMVCTGLGAIPAMPWSNEVSF